MIEVMTKQESSVFLAFEIKRTPQKQTHHFMKTLIVYYSFTHNNELLAEELQKQLTCDVLKIEESKRRNGLTFLWEFIFNRKPAIAYSPLALDHYDRFIFISPIWAGRIASPLKTFLDKERTKIKHYSFITLCGGAKGQREKILNALMAILQNAPDTVMELRLSDLTRPSLKSASPTSQRIVPEDLKEFQSSIDEFVKNSKLLADVT
jgi:flavodoxin